MRNAIFQGGTVLSRFLSALIRTPPNVIVTPPTWSLRLRRWLVSLVTCMIVYLAYAWLIVPWIEPPPPAVVDHPRGREVRPPGEATGDQELEALFPPDAWERNNPMELKTQWGRLLFQKDVPIEKGIELRPCTILFHAPTKAKDGTTKTRTIVMRTPSKAVLSFSGDISLMRAQVSKLKGAFLEDQVHIYSPETSPGANDALSIVTRNIQVQPTQIWTPYDVAFEYGASRGSGRVLTITIASNDERGSDPAKQSLVQSIKMLELVHVDRLHLEFPGRGLLDGVQGSSRVALSPRLAPPAGPPASTAVDVTCQGPLQFDFQQGIATLQDHVDVVRAGPTEDPDRLHCDRLLVYFTPGEPTDSPTDATAADQPAAAVPDERTVPKVMVSRIEAVGSDVVLQAPSVQVAARGQLLQYDFRTRHIILQDERNALFAYRQHVIESPRLEYALHEDPQRLGRVWATGPGAYRGVLSAREQPLKVHWRGTLELQPQDELHVLSVVEGGEVQSEAMGNFAADKLFVWLAEVPLPANATPSEPGLPAPGASAPREPLPGNPSADAAASAAPEATKPEKTRYEVLPVKMLAQGNVRADSEQFNGQTTQLEIWFDHPGPPPAPVIAQPEHAPSENMPPTAGQADQALLSGGNTTDSPDAQRTLKRWELSGTQIRLRLWMTRPRPIVREATILGQVRLAQLAPVPTEPAALLVTGNMLQLTTDQLERSAIDVRGDAQQPARVHAQGMLLEGADLHVSQRENLMWSEGPGRTRLPARVQHEPFPADGNLVTPAHDQNPQLSNNSPIWISWQGGMDFDGQLIRFMKQVEVSGIYTSKDGDQLYLRSVGDQLHATLNRYVEFAKSRDTDDLDVVELRFLGDVYTENQTFNAENALTSHDRMRARDLALDRATGAFQAVGQGWITTTRIDRGEIRHRVGAPGAPSTPNAGTSSGDKLIYLRIDFQNAIQGNLNLREGEFVYFVRTVYGPVLSWEQTLDPDRPDGLGPQGIVMTCNQLKIAEMGTAGKRALEMSAVGNTIVEGAGFLAKADRLTYVEAKDQLIFEGDGRSFATFQRRGRVGAEPAEFQAQKIIYGIKSNLTDVFGARQLNYNQLGSPGELPNARLR